MEEEAEKGPEKKEVEEENGGGRGGSRHLWN